MKRASYITIVMLILSAFNAIANAQEAQETQPDPCAKKAGCVKTEYDRFKDRTAVMMTPVTLLPDNGYGNPLEAIQMLLVFSSPGKVVQRPDKVNFIFAATDRYNTGQEPPAFRRSRGVDLLIDEVPTPLGTVQVLSRRLNEFDLYFPTWTYSLEVPFDLMEKIAVAKQVEIRAGSVDTFLNDDTKAAFRRLVELVPKREPAAPAAQKNASPSVKRPKAARMPQRRTRP